MRVDRDSARRSRKTRLVLNSHGIIAVCRSPQIPKPELWIFSVTIPYVSMFLISKVDPERESGEALSRLSLGRPLKRNAVRCFRFGSHRTIAKKRS